MTEERLPVAEWPWRTVIVLEASLETRDRGRGINSTLSEKPTLAVFGRRAVAAAGIGGVVMVSDTFAFSNPDCIALSRELANAASDCASEGLVGALPPRGAAAGICGFMIAERSWHEMAADRL